MNTEVGTGGGGVILTTAHLLVLKTTGRHLYHHLPLDPDQKWAALIVYLGEGRILLIMDPLWVEILKTSGYLPWL